MSAYKYFNKLNFHKLLEHTAARSYATLLNRHENILCDDKIKILRIPCRCVRGSFRVHDHLPRKTSNDDVDASENNVTPGSKTREIKRSKLKDLLDNAVSDARTDVAEPSEIWSQKPYPNEFYKKPDNKPYHNPKDASIFLFPGQGAQFVGMGKRLLQYPNVERMFNIASEIVGYNLLNLCLHGPKQELDKTVYCQPAVVVTSLAAVEKLKDESPHVVDTCVAAAGFSVGEITALIFAGVMTFEDGIKLTRIRAEAMQSASEMEAGGMMSVFYGADARIGFACNAAVEWSKRKGIEDPQCVIASYLFPGCKVIAGNNEALNFLKLNAKDFGIKKYKELPVSGAFHTKLMLPAEESVKVALKSMQLNDPFVSVYSNTNGKRYADVAHIRRLLPKQICSPVKWEQTLHNIYARAIDLDFPKTFECGPGKSLTAVLEKVNGKARDNMQSIDT